MRRTKDAPPLRGGRARLLLAMALSAGLCQCTAAPNLIYVTVDSVPTDTASLYVDANLQAEPSRSMQLEFTEDLTRFSITLQKEQSGKLLVSADAMSSNGCVLARGSESLQMQPQEALQNMSVGMQPLPAEECLNFRVTPQGDGSGTVSSMPDEILCAPACDTRIQTGKSLTLTACADPKSYFMGWSNSCTGAEKCTVSVGRTTPVSKPSFRHKLCNSAGFCWDNPLPLGNFLRRVWGSSANSVVMVGDNAILRWDGRSLRLQSELPATLLAVFGFSDQDIFAAGSEGTILHYDGTAWSLMDSTTSKQICAVWGSSKTDVYAVTCQDSGLWGPNQVLHFDGAHWSALPRTTNSWLSGIWGTDAAHVYAVGSQGIFQIGSDGPVLLSGQGGSAIWMADPSHLFVVGPHGKILHGDGVNWTAMPKLVDHDLVAVFGRSAEDVYAVGYIGSSWAIPTSEPVVLHWNGTVWQEQSTPALFGLSGVWVDPQGTAWAVGHRGELLRQEQGQWRRFGPSISLGALHSIWGSGPNDIYAASGWADTSEPPPGELLHWDGCAWRALSIDNTQWLTGVWGSGPTDVFAVGWGGLVMHYDGTSWKKNVLANGNATISAIWGTASNNVYVVTWEGSVFHFDGNQWSGVVDNARHSLNQIWGSDANNILIVGKQGFVLRFDGNSWTQDTGVSTAADLNGVWGSSASDVYVAGDSKFLHWNGTAWSDVQFNINGRTAKDYQFYGLGGRGRNDVYVVGNGGALHFDGQTWKEDGMRTGWPLRAVFSPQPGHWIIGGERGYLIEHHP